MWHEIIAYGQHRRSDSVGCFMPSSSLACTQSNDVWRGMPSSPLGSTHGQTTSGVAIHHRQWVAHMVKRRSAWHDITALGQHTQSNDVGCDMPSPHLDNTLGKMTSGVACHHHRWAAHTVERRWACHEITSLGQHTRSNDVGRVMTSPPLDSTHSRQRRAWHDITALG